MEPLDPNYFQFEGVKEMEGGHSFHYIRRTTPDIAPLNVVSARVAVLNDPDPTKGMHIAIVLLLHDIPRSGERTYINGLSYSLAQDVFLWGEEPAHPERALLLPPERVKILDGWPQVRLCIADAVRRHTELLFGK